LAKVKKVPLAASGQSLASRNRQQHWARELFKPSEDSWTLVQ